MQYIEMALSAGDKLGPYEFVSLPGKGGMGEVYEARSIVALNHPNVCQLYNEWHNYLVMEFVEGAPGAPPDPWRLMLVSPDGKTQYGIRAKGEHQYLFSLTIATGQMETIGDVGSEFGPRSYLGAGIL